MDIRSLLTADPNFRRDFSFGLCMACPLHDGVMVETCPYKKLMEDCKNEKRSLLTKIKSLPIEKIDEMLDYHYGECPKNE